MNLEFICCILYGLNDIYEKRNILNKKIKSKNKFKSSNNFNSLGFNSTSNNYSTYNSMNDISNDKFAENENINEETKAKILSNLEDSEFVEKIVSQSKTFKFSYLKLFNENDFIDKEEEKSSDLNNNTIKDNNDYIGLEYRKSILSEYEEDSSYITKEVRANTYMTSFDAEIIEYCPSVFLHLRKEENLDYDDMIYSINPFKNTQNMLNLKESAGKSGSFFFFSHDNRFIIKTVKDHELETLLNYFMVQYYPHIINNPDSLLTRIYGIFTVVLG